MIYSIVLVLAVPLFLSNLIKLAACKGRKEDVLHEWTGKYLDGLQLFFLCLAVIAMFASQGRQLLENPILLLQMLPPVLLFFAVNFILALFLGAKLDMPYSDRVALLFTTSARNSPIALAIATVAFPERPLISLALIIGPLLELSILALDSSILLRLFSDKDSSLKTT